MTGNEKNNTAKIANVVVLVSGGGTNLQAILDAERDGKIKSGRVRLVISNKEGAYALERARAAGVPTAVVTKKACGSPEAFEDALMEKIDGVGADLIVLAGFMSILSSRFTKKYERMIINVHPSLIPSFCGEGFYGLRVHEAALKKGVKVTGATVHYVNEIPDGGEIICQRAVSVREGDTPETLQRRVMEEAEWIILPSAVEEVCAEKMKIKKNREAKRDMDIYKVHNIGELIKGNSYVGRGIVAGLSADGKHAAAAYFIMGRSSNSRNRVFAVRDGAVFTEPYDASKVEDPSLIIYAAVRELDDKLIVTNGDQTDTIYDGMRAGETFPQALMSRRFEPDAPNLTPRISAVLDFDGGYSYEMSILKSADAAGTACNRYTFSYEPLPGVGHFIHTYVCDGDPIPTFQGEPERVAVPDSIDEFTDTLWDALDADNKISLYVRYVDIATGEKEERTINKNK